jgi:hypothetical protein
MNERHSADLGMLSIGIDKAYLSQSGRAARPHVVSTPLS